MSNTRASALEFFDRPYSFLLSLLKRMAAFHTRLSHLFSLSLFNLFVFRFSFLPFHFVFIPPRGEFLLLMPAWLVLTCVLTVHSLHLSPYCETVLQRRPLHLHSRSSTAFLCFPDLLYQHLKHLPHLLHNVITRSRPCFRVIRDRPAFGDPHARPQQFISHGRASCIYDASIGFWFLWLCSPCTVHSTPTDPSYALRVVHGRRLHDYAMWVRLSEGF
jgi:hypothetical protein